MARSAKKGPYVDERLLKRILDARSKGGNSGVMIKTWSRSCMITPDFVSSTVHVHDGKRFISVYISESMVGHKLGEFAPTRTFRLHSGQRKTAGAKGAAK